MEQRGKKGQQVPIHQINDNDYYYEEGPYPWDNSWSQEWFPQGDATQQWSGQELVKKLVRFLNNHSLEILQLPHRQWAITTRSGL
eukprot:2845718-Amphidinium_carterae.2